MQSLSHVRAAASVARFVWTHPTNRGHRLRAIIRSAMFEAYIRATGRTRRTPFGQRSQVIADRGHSSSVFAFHANPPDYNAMQVWRRHLQSGDLFVDVGANIGLYTLWALEQGADVISLEPDMHACSRLREHLELNGVEANVLQAAAGAARGWTALTSGKDAANHLLLDVDGDVEMVTIDDLVGGATVAGMKVDVEGAERLVLEGATSALRGQRIRLLQLEWNGLSEVILGESRRPVAEMLARYGYKLAYPTESGTLIHVSDPPSHPGAPDVFALPE